MHEAAASGTWSHDVTAALGRLEAVTLHRLLGWRPGWRTRFRHDAAHPLAVDVVVVDETSMVPLPIMARLLEAMPVTARVVLVGDPDQLESVEVGAVLGDIVRSTAMRPAVVRLERQYRTAVGSPIAELAGLVRQGRADDVLDLLHAGADGLTYVGFAAAAAAVREAVLADLLAARDAATSGDAPAALAHVSAQRVLCAHRRGPFGVAEWSRTVRGWVQGPLDRPAPGDVVLATRNDARTGTNNGDTGVLVDRDGALVAAFARGAATIERAPAQIAGLEAAYAMTVHKSQGSEYDTVALIHPPESSPLVGRELLYTAVTRAARRLVIVADDAAVRRAVLTPARRVTGLVDALDTEP